MALRAVTLLMLSLLHTCCPRPHTRPDNGLNKCRSTCNPHPALEVLPGGGWDNLRNLDMGRVMNLSFSQCQTSEDGVYLLPDEVFVIPRKQTSVETVSEIISSWLDHQSSTSRSINAEVSYELLLNAKFSTENQRVKSHQVKDSATTTRVQVRNFLYTVKAYPDFTLDSRFAGQAEDIAEAIENNHTRKAAYLSEMMVLDYGTHVITSVDAGASLVQEDYLQSTFVTDKNKHSVTTTAGLNFLYYIKFNINASQSSESAESREYKENITYSTIENHGGEPFYPGITLQKWQESTRKNLVAIDRSGLPLNYFLNQNTLPKLSGPIIDKVALSVSQAIERYYKINTRPGCVKVDSKNFNFQANVDDGSCDGPASNLTFGGVYQTCTQLTPEAGSICRALAQKNPIAGNFACPPNVRPTLLNSEEVEEGYFRRDCTRSCESCGFLWLSKCCTNKCVTKHYVSSARIDTYWCSDIGQIPKFSGYLFGGLYSPSDPNPLTKSKSCPPTFIPLKLFSKGLMICVSNDYKAGGEYSVPFGGLSSCKSTNPLAGVRVGCPPRFSQHLATVSDGCEIHYCVQSGLFTGGELKPIQLPPFTRPPLGT